MDTAQLAITQAMNCDWKAAIHTNIQILKNDPTNIDALNRLARAYIETGKIKKAKETSKKVLGIDPINTIAFKCLDKCKSLKDGVMLEKENVNPEAFFEIPGKTKIVDLLHLGHESVLALLDSGDEVKFSTHPHRVSVVTKKGNKYIGRLPDDLSARIRNQIKNGVKFQVIIKNVDVKNVKVFIRIF